MIAEFRIRVVALIFLACSCALSQQPQAPPTAQPASPDVAAIFQQRCAKCHGDKGQGVSGFITFGGPNIEAEHETGPVMTAMEVGPSHMPSFARILSLDEMRSVADYVTHTLAVIPLGGGDLGEGGELFRVYCAPCHRTAVRGGVMVYTGVNAPALVHQSPAIIAGAIRWGPGDMPAFPSTVLNDHQLNSIVRYIQFVQHPPAPGGRPMNWFGPVAEGLVAWVALFMVIAITGWIEKGGKG
ncbi:MAG: c-type cytochrome [Terriglobales bacterium]